MTYAGERPGPPLDLFVDDVYVLSGAPGARRRLNVPPMPSAHLLVNLGDPVVLRDSDAAAPPLVLEGAWATGLWTRRFTIEYGSGVRVAGVYPSGVDTPMLRLEARHGGSLLNFVGRVHSVPDVVAADDKALTGRRLEVYLPYTDSITTRLAHSVPGAANRIIPLFERFGRRGHAKYLARIDAEEASAEG